VKEALRSDDLSILARRHEATPSERRRLDMLLHASPVERFLHELGEDFDAMDADASGDAPLLARAVARAAGTSVVAPRWGRRHVAVAGIAVGCFVTLGAAALTIPRALTPAVAPAPAEPSAATQVEGSRPAVVVPRARDVAEPAAAPSSSASLPPVLKPLVPVPPPLSSAEQFAHANALRKSGQLDAAIAGYWQLQRQYPGSSEALLSHVLLGRLLLRQGSASAAHAQFSRYLQRSPGGSLAEEALHGQAGALRVSGRIAEERQVHRELLRRFPSSVYAGSSRARLAELD
jgi:TolA-binding protein